MKILITEEQLKLIEGHNSDILSIRDLAKIIADRGYGDEAIDIFHKILLKHYKRFGDDGVIEYFTNATGVGIEQISKGHYIFWR